MADKTQAPIPERIGKYVVKRLLGKGGMGRVYHAYDPFIGRDVALKVMLPDLAEDPVLKERFVREAQSAGRLRHPNIVTIYDLGEDDGVPYIAMEYLEGRDLDELIRTRAPLTVDEKLDIIRQACEALGYAHAQGVVHRDIKPSNIRVLDNHVVKIMDFGIAKMGATHFTQTGIIMGTPHYMAPEQVRGEREKIDGRTDIFALGVVLYEFLVYRRPFEGEHYTTVFYKIVHEPPAPITADVDIPYLEDIWAVIEKALAKDIEARYPSAYDMGRDLQAIIRKFRDEKTTLVTQSRPAEEPRTVLVTTPPRPTERPTVQAPPPPKPEPATVLASTPPRAPTRATVVAPPTPSTPSEISIAVEPPVEGKRWPVGLWAAVIGAFLVVGATVAYLTYRWWPADQGNSAVSTDHKVRPPDRSTTSGETAGKTGPAEEAEKAKIQPEEELKPPPARETTSIRDGPKTTPSEQADNKGLPPPPETVKGTLFINLLPWAEILRVERSTDGFRVPIPTPAYTPLWVRDIPTGRYVVEYRHPAMSAPATVEVDVVGSQVTNLIQPIFRRGLPPELLQDLPEP
jgi:serine/threonine protein kinase